ncbi:MAG: STAS domain-containing protein [Rhodospirillales bacterium]|nr:STAS domain-containing protein [Rhodospirillales bacterium]MDH3913384.1 STAS domain-containing protein [Rhodospirillales bacterium]MDH3919372.1 STAS domain-containing protein [Rhodospirillales bacterium]MDH3966445.1 STAS domain-containing protein [Rhodospirillales bacterium]
MRDEVSEIDGKVVVKLSGDVDLEHCTVVRGLLLDAVSHGKDLLVDLSGVSYLDSSGIASLVEALQIAARNGTALKLFSASAQAMRVFELARLDKVFAIHPDLDAALAS